ncbi:UPF0764 protein C16orf89 homolog [Dermacentor andersoni]|uniref:UPF0764 protein C16orf89 homolog n=1 Tax=Dermacentor andersoni TaxID=34620 RepID=UPI002155CAB3|nr:UPF0764 protein C16orf89 homolog [Dermacentor andersoni]
MATLRSGSALRQAVLVAALFTRSFCVLAPREPSSAEQRSLDWRVLSALDGAVDALAANMDAVYMDAALGLRVADDRLQKLIDQASDSENNIISKPTKRASVTIEDIRAVQQKTSTLADIAAARVVGRQEASVSQTLARGLLRKGLWKDPPIAADTFRARTSDDDAELAAPDVIEGVSDGCLQQLFAGRNCCQLNDSCWVAMTGGRQHGYALTHQAIFLTVGIRLNCTAKLNGLATRHGQPPADWNLASKCARVADNAQLIVDENFPLRLRDLFMEQVAVCGFMDLPVFRDRSAMEDVLSWQRDDGCYVVENEPAVGSLPQRIKREERKGKDQCSLHMTSVAAGALATYLQILHQTRFANRTARV